MMDCKKIRELSLTDYADGETGETVRKEVAEHIATCQACRALETAVRERIKGPFASLERQTVPPFVWEKIHRKIISPKTWGAGSIVLRERLAEAFTLHKPAFGLVAVAVSVALFFVVQASLRTDTAGDYLTEQVEFMVSLSAGNGMYGVEDVDIGAELDEYLF